MAKMVCKHKPLATVNDPIDSILPPSEELHGELTETLGCFSPKKLAVMYRLDGEWSSYCNSDVRGHVSVLDICKDGNVDFNISNNNTTRSGNAKFAVKHSTQARHSSKDHDSTYSPLNRRLTPIKHSFGHGSVANKRTTITSDEGIVSIPDCGKDFNKSLYPELADVKIGPTEFMSAMGMRPLVCSFGYVEHSSGPELSLSFVLSISCLISTNFSWRSKTIQNCDDYLFQILKNSQLTFRLRFPYQGFYTLEIFAQKRSTSELPKNVFNYIIRTPDPDGQSILPFPKAHKDWFVSGFALKQPLDGILPSNSQSKFVLRVFRALKVFITSGGVSVNLKEHEGSWWIGLIETGDPGSEIGLYAVFALKSQVAVPLLSFQVAPSIDGSTAVEMTAFETEIVAIERKRLEQLLKSNREWLNKISKEEEKHSMGTISSHKARLLRLSRKHSTKMGHTKNKLKMAQQKKLLPELLKHEQKILEKLRNDCKKRLKDIRRVESETFASIEEGGKKAIQKIKKSLNSFLQGSDIPQKNVTDRLGDHMQLMAELEALHGQLFSKDTSIEDSISEISNIHESMLTAIAELQMSTLESLGLVVKKATEEDREVLRGLIDTEAWNQLENMEQEELKEITVDAKAFVDGTSNMKHESMKQIYSLQIKEMQLQDSWIKTREMKMFQLRQIGSPVGEITIYLQTEINEEMKNCKERLLIIKDAISQQSQYLEDVYKQKLSQFKKSEQEKLTEFETKLGTTLEALCATDENLLHQLGPKFREIVNHLEGHLAASVQEIGARDLTTFLSIRNVIADNIYAELQQAQADMLDNVASVISMNASGQPVINTDIISNLGHSSIKSWKHANRVRLSDFALDTLELVERMSKSVPEVIHQTIEELSKSHLLQHSKGVEESEEEEQVDEEPSKVPEARRCSFLMMESHKDCKDTVLQLIEQSTERLTQASGRTSTINIHKQSLELTDTQRTTTKAVLQIEDMLTLKTKETLNYIKREVYENFRATMMTVKQSEEERLLQVRRVKQESMQEMKDWLKTRFAMMQAHDIKTAAKLKEEVSSMVDAMESLAIRRIECIKGAFENNEARIKAHFQEGYKLKRIYEEESRKSKTQLEQSDQSNVLNHIKAIYAATVSELESKVNSCYKSIKKTTIAELLKIELNEQVNTSECKARVHKQFWGNVREGEQEVVNELQTFCHLKEREETEIAHDCINGEEEVMDIIKTDTIKKCNDINRCELRNRTESRKVEDSRLEEIGALLKDNPWLWSEVKKEEADRLLEKRICGEERLFELEKRQDEALASLRASREMRLSQIENKFREKHIRLRREFLKQGADYIVDTQIIGEVRNVEEKILLDIQNLHKETVNSIKIADHRIFREMEVEIRNTFEKISGEYQSNYRSALEMQDGVYAPFRALEEEIRTANKAEISEDKIEDTVNEMKGTLYKILEVREKTQLRVWLNTVSCNGLEDQLSSLVINVEMILRALDRIDELRYEAISLDIRKPLTVLTGFQTPSPTIHEALKGILLTLGDHEGFTSEWKNCIRRITPIGRATLKWRIKRFVIKDLDPRIAKRAMDILQEVPFEKIEEISPELLTYCLWAWAVCEERLEATLHRTPEPATLNEQIQIFKGKNQSKGPVAGPRVLVFDIDETLSRHTDQMLETRKKKLFTYRDRPSDENDLKYYLDS